MSYEEWLQNIELLKKSDNQEIKNKLLDEAENSNIQSLLEPKIIELIKHKLEKTTQNVINNLGEMYSDENILDMLLVSLKKSLKFIVELTYIKQISNTNQEELRNSLKVEIEEIYKILINGANQVDNIGLLALTIKNNMYKME